MASTTTSFSSATGLATLLTVESLMFSALSVAIALSSVQNAPRRLLPEARQLAGQAAFVLTVIASGAGIAWWDIFVRHGSCDLTQLGLAACLLVGLVAQPIFAWRLAHSLRRT